MKQKTNLSSVKRSPLGNTLQKKWPEFELTSTPKELKKKIW
jgi:hypothetical protein